MKLHLIFIGNMFIYNKSLQEYIIRKIEDGNEFISSITYFKDGDNSIFLYLEEELNSSNKSIIITNKQNSATIGKLISTVTSDNQVLKDGMLIPSNALITQERSYLLEYKDSVINIIQIDEMQKMPTILISDAISSEKVFIFGEEKDNAIALLEPIAQTYEVNIEVIVIVNGFLKVNAFSKKYGNLSKFINYAKHLLPRKLIHTSNIITHIIDKLSKDSKKITFAESCTGGLMSYYLTKENGASEILDGSLVTYSNKLKENWLAVSKEVIESEGAVSSDVVSEMSDGALNVSDADYSIAISGIAGDFGGTKDKPVGTVYIGVRTKDEHIEEHLVLFGDRNYVQHQSVLHALKMLINIDKNQFF